MKDWLDDPVISWFMDYIMAWVGIGIIVFVSVPDIGFFDAIILSMKFGAWIVVLGYGPLAFLVFLPYSLLVIPLAFLVF
jgi:hypothetical protein